MKRLLPVLLALSLMVPGAAMAKDKKVAKKSKAKIVDSEKCSGDKDVKSVNLGKEVVFVSEDLKSASFTKDETHTLKHNLGYYDAKTGFSKRTPGVSPDGEALVPAFKHGEAWHIVSRDANGAIIVDGAAPEATIAPAPLGGDVIAPAPEKVKKPAKKGKKGKKAKKAKKEKKAEEKPAAPAEEKK
ncbi:MAG: hypothetical protein WA705_17430 [Candidatus Ozemobacteraceae bacterium]